MDSQARRALKALKSLVRLQAVARGAYVRRQAEAAVHCMQAMAGAAQAQGQGGAALAELTELDRSWSTKKGQEI